MTHQLFTILPHTSIWFSSNKEAIPLQLWEEGEKLQNCRIQITAYICLVPGIPCIVFCETEPWKLNTNNENHIEEDNNMAYESYK